MPELELFHIGPSRSSSVHWLLEEIGEPFELHLVPPGGTRAPEYLAVNPMGKVPTLRHGKVFITEAPAICLYLADAFPKAGLAPAVGEPGRGPYLQWMVFSTACLEPALIDAMLQRPAGPPNALGWGSLEQTLATLETTLAAGPYLLGERFSAADVMIGSELIWGMAIGQIDKRDAFTAYSERLQARPAQAKAMAKDRALMEARSKG